MPSKFKVHPVELKTRTRITELAVTSVMFEINGADYFRYDPVKKRGFIWKMNKSLEIAEVNSIGVIVKWHKVPKEPQTMSLLERGKIAIDILIASK